MNFDDLKDNIDVEKIEKAMKIFEKISIIQEKIEKGEFTSEKEMNAVTKMLQTSVADINRIFSGENVEIPSLDYYPQESTDSEPPITTVKPKKQIKKVKEVKEVEKRDQKEIQEEFDDNDFKYQEMMKRGNLTDDEIKDICKFYHVGIDDIKSQLEKNQQKSDSNYDSDTRTYAKDKEKKQKRSGLFKKR